MNDSIQRFLMNFVVTFLFDSTNFIAGHSFGSQEGSLFDKKPLVSNWNEKKKNLHSFFPQFWKQSGFIGIRLKNRVEFSPRPVPPNLIAAEKEEAKAVLTLFFKKQGLSNSVSARIINKSEQFIDHLVSRLHSVYKSRYLVGRFDL